MHIAQIIERFRVPWIQLESPPISSLGIAKTAAGLVHDTEVGNEDLLVRLQLCRPTDKPEGFIEPSLRKGGHSQEVQRIGLHRLEREDATVETLCLIEAPGLMMRERLLQTGDDQDRPLPAAPIAT
jgi:hypothetical protein